MKVKKEAIERFEQTKRTLNANFKSDYLDYMAYIGAVIECNLLIEQYYKESKFEVMMYHKKMKEIIVGEFEKYCLKNGEKFKH